MPGFVDVVVVLAMLGVVAVTYVFIYRRADVTYQLVDDELVLRVHVCAFIPLVMRVGLDSIRSYELHSPWSALGATGWSWPIMFGNPRRRVVVIRRSKGLLRSLIVSPPDVEPLLALLREAVPSAELRR